MDTKLMFKYLKKLPGKWIVPIVAIIWVLHFALRKPSVTTCIILTVLLIVGWLIYLLLRWFMARGKGEEIEEVPELKEFEGRLINAVNSDKKAPWYLVVGPSGCGKTSLLRNSELDFSYIDSLQKKPIEQGIEKTRNCDLFYAKGGIILDTTGRYVTSGKEAQARTEWLGLLALLKKHRETRPIDGLVVAIDIDRLLQNKEGIIAGEARNIRERIVEAISVLGITFPVYLVFTKCDAIYGFTEFFGDMSNADRAQIWGATLRSVQQEDPETAFKGECQRLVEALETNKLQKFGSVSGQAGLPVYAFPAEFEGVCEKLVGFVSELFHTVSEEKPMFRGFYFTSGAQGESRPIEYLLDSVAKSLDRRPPPAEARTGDRVGAKGYFIKDLFNKIIFPDQGLDRPTTAAGRRKTVMRLGICGTIVGILAILGIIFGVSYAKNKNLMSETERASISVTGIRSDTQPVEKLERFERLRKAIIKLEKFALFSFPWQGARESVALNARKLYLPSKYGSAAGAEIKLGRNVEIPVKVFKSEAGELVSIEKADIKVVINGKEQEKRLPTNKEGETALKMRVKDGKAKVEFSTDYQLTGYEVQRQQTYEIQPGDHDKLESVQFIFSKSGRIITVHCVDQFGEDLSGVPVSIIEKIDESKKYGPETSNEKGMASLSLEAQEGSVLLVYYGDSPINYPEDQPDTVTIQPGETRYSLEKQLRRKMEISVIAFTQATAESQRQPNPGVSVSVGGMKLGLTDNSGQWKGPSGAIPTRQNVAVDPAPKSMKIDKVASGYSIVLEYAPKVKPPKETTTTPIPQPPPPRYVSAVDESKNPVVGVEIWMYAGAGDGDSNQISFESEGKKISLVLLGTTADSEGRLELPDEAKDQKFHLCHPDYWPIAVSWQQTKQPIQMISIKQERAFGDFSKAQIDGAESYYQLAQRYHNRDVHKEAVKNYQNAIRLIPRLKYYLQLGWAYQEMDQTEDALKQVNIGLELKLLDDPEANEQLLKQQLQELLGLL